MTPGRADVIWFGEQPGEAVLLEYRLRDLRVVSADPADSNQALTARAAVFAAASGSEEAVAKLIVANAPRLRDFGLALEGVAVDDGAVQRLMEALTDSGFPLDLIRLREWPSGYRLAQDAALYDPGSAPSLSLPVSMLHNAEPPTARDKLLLQRAFSDCVGIELASLQGGRSDARVFSVHAARRGSYIGVRSQPLFAKIDEIAKVKREFLNYRNFAEPFIPFGLRPNVRELVVGNGRAVLVGDFVDRSEALRDLISRDVATHEMHMLYHETLAGWIDQGYARDPAVGSIGAVLETAGICKPDRFNAKFAEMLDCREPAASIWRRLLALNRHRYRLAPAHGDLHGENVRVRQGQAILIDLASVCEAPTTVDVASLETALAFDVPRDAPNGYADEVWRAEVERLYDVEAFRHAPGPCRQPSGLSWMTAAVRQLRRMGLGFQTSPGEYRVVVAALLMRRCQWVNEVDNDRYRRAVGYGIAAKLADEQQGDRP